MSQFWSSLPLERSMNIKISFLCCRYNSHRLYALRGSGMLADILVVGVAVLFYPETTHDNSFSSWHSGTCSIHYIFFHSLQISLNLSKILKIYVLERYRSISSVPLLQLFPLPLIPTSLDINITPFWSIIPEWGGRSDESWYIWLLKKSRSFLLCLEFLIRII